MSEAPTCCSTKTVLVAGAVIYPGRMDLASKPMWLCPSCAAYVGCHPGTTDALGTPAGPALRRMRNLTHRVFDSLWRSGEMSRGQAYAWLRRTLELTAEQTHVGLFDEALCRRAINAVADRDPYAAEREV